MPDEYVLSIHQINLEKLWADGKRLILTDLDNTLVPWNHPDVPAELVNWLKRAKSIGFQVCILSNNSSNRVSEFAKVSGIPAIGAAKKPKPHGFMTAMSHFDVQADQVVMVGDQLFTDIRGGNRIGLYTVLVQPIDPREWWGTRMVRNMERLAFVGLRRRGLKSPGEHGGRM